MNYFLERLEVLLIELASNYVV